MNLDMPFHSTCNSSTLLIYFICVSLYLLSEQLFCNVCALGKVLNMNGKRRIQCINQGMIGYNKRNWQTTAMSNSCWMRKIFLWTYNGVKA